MQGRLGHQILGQLLVFDTDEAAVAGATVVLAATTRQRNAIAQAAIRTAAPAIAVHGLLSRDLKRLENKEALLAERLRRIKERDAALLRRELDLDSGRAPVAGARRLGAPKVLRDALQRIAQLEEEKAGLISRLPPAPPLPAPPPPAPPPPPPGPRSASPVRSRKKAASPKSRAGAKPARLATSSKRPPVRRGKPRKGPGSRG